MLERFEDLHRIIQGPHRIRLGSIRNSPFKLRAVLFRSQEHLSASLPRAHDLLGNTSDRADLAVHIDRARASHLRIPRQRTRGELIDQTQRHHRARRRATDVLNRIRNLEREPRMLSDINTQRRLPRIRRNLRGGRDLHLLAVADDAQLNRTAVIPRLGRLDRLLDLSHARNALTIHGDHRIVGLQHSIVKGLREINDARLHRKIDP